MARPMRQLDVAALRASALSDRAQFDAIRRARKLLARRYAAIAARMCDGATELCQPALTFMFARRNADGSRTLLAVAHDEHVMQFEQRCLKVRARLSEQRALPLSSLPTPWQLADMGL